MSISGSFDGNMSREVLEYYLSHAATASDLLYSTTLEDDIRVIKELGIQFLGRAAGVWYLTIEDELQFTKARQLAEQIHKADPSIILQACIFEMVVEKMDDIPIPSYVFEDLGLPVEHRNFCWEQALFAEKPLSYLHPSEDRRKNGGIPDLNRLEARLWFYYRATRYIDSGYEALHMGQVHLYTANDIGMKNTYELFGQIRAYGAKHGRRHKVLLDAHTHGVSVRGDLLLDYHAMPYTRMPLLQKEGQEVVLVREGISEGGRNPNGWQGEVMPYLMEYDNWGGLVVSNPEELSREELAVHDWWGYDQIGWFANQPAKSRDHFLEYTYRWTEINNANAFFELPFRRMLSDAAVTMERADSHKMDKQEFYQINQPSRNCPMGFGQEAMARQIFRSGHSLREKAANPIHLLDYGAKEVYDEDTGLKLPIKVVVYGDFQAHVGAMNNDSNSEVTRMYYIGNRTYVLSVVIPFAGTYDFAISTYGTLSSTYCTDRYPRSGSSNKSWFTTDRDNTIVKFTYRFVDNEVRVELFES